MRITHLKLTNVRSIRAAELRFEPGFNLIVGDNGAGKTTILEALAVCISEYVRSCTGDTKARPFGDEAIRAGAESLDVECRFEHRGSPARFVIHKPRERRAGRQARREFVGSRTPSIPHAHEVREDGAGYAADLPEPAGRPLGVLYSTARAVPKERAPRSLGGRTAAYEDALRDREVGLGYFASWMSVKQSLDVKGSRQALAGVQNSVRRFLPGYSDLRLDGADGRTLLIDRHGETIAVRHLSHGERGILAVVLDLTWRLAQLNVESADPASETSAVVLIDEIDLHLHPKWQREIVHKLTETFPRCQFIATTHSPQVIGEVEPDRIQIISDDAVYHPEYSFGFDSNRVLQDIMEADPRTRTVFELLTKIKKEIGNEAFTPARQSLKQLIAIVGERDPEVTRIRTLLEFLDEGQ